MTTTTDILLTESIDMIIECFELRIVSEIKDSMFQDSNVIGYTVACSSVIRKETILPLIKAFVKIKTLPVTIEDKYPNNNSFQILNNQL